MMSHERESTATDWSKCLTQPEVDVPPKEINNWLKYVVYIGGYLMLFENLMELMPKLIYKVITTTVLCGIMIYYDRHR